MFTQYAQYAGGGTVAALVLLFVLYMVAPDRTIRAVALLKLTILSAVRLRGTIRGEHPQGGTEHERTVARPPVRAGLGARTISAYLPVSERERIASGKRQSTEDDGGSHA